MNKIKLTQEPSLLDAWPTNNLTDEEALKKIPLILEFIGKHSEEVNKLREQVSSMNIDELRGKIQSLDNKYGSLDYNVRLQSQMTAKIALQQEEYTIHQKNIQEDQKKMHETVDVIAEIMRDWQGTKKHAGILADVIKFFVKWAIMLSSFFVMMYSLINHFVQRNASSFFEYFK